MEDFLTRLAERTLGAAPVVQPLIASMFVSEPTGHSLDLERNSEAAMSSGDLDRAQAPSAKETPPARDAPTRRPEGTAVDRQGHHGNSPPATPGHHQSTYDTQPEPHRLAKPALAERRVIPTREEQRSLSLVMAKRPQRTSDAQPEPRRDAETASLEHRVIPEQEDQQNLSPGTLEPHQRTLDRPELFHAAESGPTRRDVDTVSSDRVLPEDLSSDPSAAEGASDQAIPRPIRTLIEHGRGATLPPEPSPDTQGSILESEAVLNHPAPLDALLVTPGTIRPQLNGHVERDPWEPRMAAPEPPAPTIRVAIGRIEVRAITPPPTPPARQRATPARPGPALSLDDYLKRRNGGQR
jgi:hypothetical protein